MPLKNQAYTFHERIELTYNAYILQLSDVQRSRISSSSRLTSFSFVHLDQLTLLPAFESH